MSEVVAFALIVSVAFVLFGKPVWHRHPRAWKHIDDHDTPLSGTLLTRQIRRNLG